jgi:hypothetical protein
MIQVPHSRAKALKQVPFVANPFDSLYFAMVVSAILNENSKA